MQQTRSRDLSLSIHRREDKALVNCFGGCELAEVLDSLGMAMRDLFDGERPARFRPPPRAASSPWDQFLHVGIEHVLRRMTTEQALEADPGLRERARVHGDDCPVCRSGM